MAGHGMFWMSARVYHTGFPVCVDSYAKFSLVLGKSKDILQSDLLRGQRAGDLTFYSETRRISRDQT